MFSVAAVFADRMVLQRDRPVRIWGRAPAGEYIDVVCGENRAGAFADARGSWAVTLPPHPAATGLTLQVRYGDHVRTFRDVAFGEVWVAAGQSNMEFPLGEAVGGEHALSNARTDVRMFHHEHGWLRSPEAIRTHASAVGWWAGDRLARRLGVPVGVVCAYRGGTSILAWLDREDCARFPAGRLAWARAMRTLCTTSPALTQALEEDFVSRCREREAARVRYESSPRARTKAHMKARIGATPWPPPVTPTSPFLPGAAKAAIVNPLRGLSVRGFWWYQGEEDVSWADGYAEAVGLLIGRWRRHFTADEAPFLIVQLPGYREGLDHAAHVRGDEWARLRDAQARACELYTNVHLVVSIDQGEIDEIHPADKRPIGQRLGDVALLRVYDHDAPVSPQWVGGFCLHDTAVLGWDATIADGDWDEGSSGVEVADVSGRWFPARVRVREGMVCANSEYVARPCGARYAWSDYPAAPLRAETGLPAAPGTTGPGGLVSVEDLEYR